MSEEITCLRCSTPLAYLKEYRFDSRDENRGLLGALFDVEEHLTFAIYVCPNCKHTEFFYGGSVSRFDR